MTLKQLLTCTEDGELLTMYEEISSGLIPATSHVQEFRRALNKMIDAGKLCINTTSYRKVYLPTLAKAIMQEMAGRYANYHKYEK